MRIHKQDREMLLSIYMCVDRVYQYAAVMWTRLYCSVYTWVLVAIGSFCCLCCCITRPPPPPQIKYPSNLIIVSQSISSTTFESRTTPSVGPRRLMSSSNLLYIRAGSQSSQPASTHRRFDRTPYRIQKMSSISLRYRLWVGL